MLALLFCSSLGWGAIAATANHCKGTNSAGASLQATSCTINAGDTVVVTIGVNGAGARTISGVVDSNSSDNSCFAQQSSLTTTNAVQVYTWACLSAASGGATTVTATIAGGNDIVGTIDVQTYTGVGTNGFGTQSNASLTGSGTSGTLTKAVTTVDNNNFVVCAMAQQASTSPTLTASVGNLRDQSVTGASFIVVGVNDNTAASAGSVTNTVTSNKTTNWAVSCVELRSTNSAGVVRHRAEVIQ